MGEKDFNKHHYKKVRNGFKLETEVIGLPIFRDAMGTLSCGHVY
jgi:hypothetical protein